MGRYLYDTAVFNVSVDTLSRYNQRHFSLTKNNFTAACYATMTPNALHVVTRSTDRPLN